MNWYLVAELAISSDVGNWIGNLLIGIQFYYQ